MRLIYVFSICIDLSSWYYEIFVFSLKLIITMKYLLLASVHAAACSGLVLTPHLQNTNCVDDSLSKSRSIEVVDVATDDDRESSFVQDRIGIYQQQAMVWSCCASIPSHILYLAFLIFMWAHDSPELLDGNDSGTHALSICVLVAEAIVAFCIIFLNFAYLVDPSENDHHMNVYCCNDWMSPLLWLPQLLVLGEFALFCFIGITSFDLTKNDFRFQK